MDDRLSEIRNEQKILDYLAIDAGEKYLDDIYREDEGGNSTDGEDGAFYSNEPRRSVRQPSIPYTSAPLSGSGRGMGINSTEIDTIQLSQIVAEEAERKQKARAEKELAWQKVRQLLIEEEEKASTGTVNSVHSVDEAASVHSEVADDSYGTVKLLDSLARSGGENFSYNRSVSSDVDAAPVVDASLMRSQSSSSSLSASSVSTPKVKEPNTFASHIDRMGTKLAQFLSRGQSSDDESSDLFKARRPKPLSKSKHEPFVAGKSSVRLAMLATLEQTLKSCQRAELSEESMTRIMSHLSAIDEITRDDMYKKNGHLKRGSRRLSSTQWSNSSSEHDKDFRSLVPPVVEAPSDLLSIAPAPTVITDSVQAKVVLESYKAFEAAIDLEDTLAAFNNLVTNCGLNGVLVDEPWHIYYHIKAAVYSKLSFRNKQLFKLLEARLNLEVYKRKPAAKKSVCVVGAGPVGLRAAVETALLGGQVVVVEKRAVFSRESRLHLWPWVVQDMVSLGAKVFFPQFCKTSTYFHVSTRQMQVILLKVALLIGENGGKLFYTVATKPQIPMMEFTAVLGASGTNDKLAEPAGINRFVYSNKEALGIVCYFPNLGTSDEVKAKEFSWTTFRHHPMLDKLREIGFDMENVVYYRGEMHYIVMTPKRQNLLDRRVLYQNRSDPTDLVKDDNVNKIVLHELAKRIVDFAGIPRKTDFTRVSLFDFSTLTRADHAANILSSHGKKLYVGLMGDSLLEPMWHESVGICHGFLGALDTAWMVAQIGRKADEQLLADREAAFQVVQRLSGHVRDDMQKNPRKYTADPRSRYTVQFPRVI
ncbi:MICAL-like protein [Phytophthora cinnamomi]|uniref:MICAL-like protein n=3 Tax=Phytophthora cinnamomi TaxID=4785 RepID=UPI00355A40CD|nr:MICAL-like protein [Phytophthora cinnamomi]